MNRRALLTCAAFVAGLAVAGSPGSRAQTYPSEPITLIVAWPAGGGSDISMRLIADALSKQIGVPVVVLNKPGAGGSIGHREIVNAKPRRLHHRHVPAPAASRFPISTPRPTPSTSCNPSPFSAKIRMRCRSAARQRHHVAQGLRRARPRKSGQDPRTATTSRAARPTSVRRSTRKLLNVKVTKVSYAGFGPTVIGLMGGEVDSATVPVPDTIEQHKAGKLKILGVSATERHFMAPGFRHFASKASRSSSARGDASSVERHPGRPLALSRKQHHRGAEEPRLPGQGKAVRLRRPAGRRQRRPTSAGGTTMPSSINSPRGRAW